MAELTPVDLLRAAAAKIRDEMVRCDPPADPVGVAMVALLDTYADGVFSGFDEALDLARALLADRLPAAARPVPVSDSLSDRLAATLAEHNAHTTSHGSRRVSSFECSCGVRGVEHPWGELDPDRPVELTQRWLHAGHVALDEARTHQAVQLAETVAGWLSERSDSYDPTPEQLAATGGTWTQLGGALALSRAAREIRAETKDDRTPRQEGM